MNHRAASRPDVTTGDPVVGLAQNDQTPAGPLYRIAPDRPHSSHRAPSTRRRPDPSIVSAAIALAWFGGAVSVALIAPVTTVHDVVAPGGAFTLAGRLTGLIGTYLLLITVLLVARIPAIERVLGQGALVRAHRRIGPWVIVLLVAHAVFITLGYAQGVRTGAIHELWVLLTTFPGMLGATAGLLLIVAAGVTSYRNVQLRMRYETWWSVHLYTYLAVAVAFSHQLDTGAPFLGHPLARAWWIALFALTAGVALVYRVALPLVRTLYHRPRVGAIVGESPGVISVVLRGHRLDRLGAAGGQFLHWRFLKPGMWWEAHPYSLSAVPGRSEMRITVKFTGDHGHRLTALRPGTRVAIEGPYGAFIGHARATDRLLLVAAGVGATPVRALLEDLPGEVDVVTILRAPTRQDLVLGPEIERLVVARGGRLHELVGPRSRVSLDAATLRRLVPDAGRRDLYVCGPPGFTSTVVTAARALGVPEERVHHEDFTL